MPSPFGNLIGFPPIRFVGLSDQSDQSDSSDLSDTPPPQKKKLVDLLTR